MILQSSLCNCYTVIIIIFVFILVAFSNFCQNSISYLLYYKEGISTELVQWSRTLKTDLDSAGRISVSLEHNESMQ